MEDLIYILLGIVWVVFSVINSAKKKQVKGTTEMPKSDLEEIFGEFFPKKVNPQRFDDEPEMVYETLEGPSAEKLDDEPQPISPFEAYAGEWEEEDEPSLEEMERAQPAFAFFETEEQQRQKPNLQLLQPIDLRQAIIYQTILQRPDF